MTLRVEEPARDLHSVLWRIWQSDASGEDEAFILSGCSTAAVTLAVDILQQCGVVLNELDERALELLAWAVFGTDSLPLLPRSERDLRYSTAAKRWSVDDSTVVCLARSAPILLR